MRGSSPRTSGEAPEAGLLPAPAHAESVFHVLAHVAGSAHLPSSLYDPDYVAYAEQRTGSAADRPLGRDAEVLGRIFGRHEALAELQLYTVLFEERDDASRPLGEVTDGALARRLEALGPGLEVLRCAVALEREVLWAMPPVRWDARAFEAALLSVRPAAPWLGRYGVVPCRALWRRGRLVGGRVWTGVPSSEGGPGAEHVAWQAAHEATLGEVRAAEPDLDERAAEAVAVALLAERAARTEGAEAHARWLAHWGAPPLDAAGRALMERLLR